MFELVVVVLIIAAVFALLAKRSGRARSGSSKSSAYVKLLKQAGGDDELADRLIDAERGRNPGASRERLAQLALARWAKDRRN